MVSRPSVERMLRRLTRTQLVVDLVIGAAWALLNGLPAIPDIGSMLVALGMGGVVAIRRLSPPLALALAWVVSLAQVLWGVTPLPANLATLPMLFACAAYASSRVRWVAFASAIAGAVVVTVAVAFPNALALLGQTSRNNVFDFRYDGDGARALLLMGVLFGFTVTMFLLSWTAGVLFRTWRQSRAARIAAAVAEREVAAEQERTRIARDMHDVVAHSLAVVIAQADGARYLRTADPEAVDGALQTIASTARDALADVRVLLAQLRHSQSDGPQPTIADLDRLLEQLAAAGLVVRREDTGAPLPLGTAQQMAVYRIAQESLTNALRHAETTKEVVVHVGWTPHGLDLVVSSALPAHPTAATGTGHGIAGMTERAALVGGHLTARPEDGRFVVRAWLPATQGVAA
jgi:signal transduction histidine kinase